jgi:hypothetical protein
VSDTKHTPLTIDYVGPNNSMVLLLGDHVQVTVDRREDFGDALPLARLIAAAPDLLEALKAIDRHWESGNFSRLAQLWEPMKAAIRKATEQAVKS